MDQPAIMIFIINTLDEYNRANGILFTESSLRKRNQTEYEITVPRSTIAYLMSKCANAKMIAYGG